MRFGDLQNITSILCRRRKGTDNKTKQTPKTNKTSDYEVEKRIEYIYKKKNHYATVYYCENLDQYVILLIKYIYIYMYIK